MHLFSDGLNPISLTNLVYNPLHESSPLSLRKDLKDRDIDIEKLEQFRFIRQFLLDVKASQPLKLTTKGNVNRKFVHQLYDHRIITSKYVDDGTIKLMGEEDFYPIHFSHVITKMAGIVRKYKNKLSLTKKGEKALASNAFLYLNLLEVYTEKYSWAYMSYAAEHVVQFGWAFSMYQFIRYGSKERNMDYYIERYLDTFPEMLEQYPQNNPYVNPPSRLASDFRHLFFGRFCELFGLAEQRTEGEDILKQQHFVKKTALLDKVFLIKDNIGGFASN